MDTRSYLEMLGFAELGELRINLSPTQLIEEALRRGEGEFTATGAFSVRTGKYTGRSPHDRYIVDTPAEHDRVDWGEVNQPISEENWRRLMDKVSDYLKKRELFVFDGFVGKDPRYHLAVKVVTEKAWQNLFAHQLLVRPNADETIAAEDEFLVVAVPELYADPATDGTKTGTFIVLNLSEKIILIGGSSYAGEIKKSCFSLMNYLMPQQGVCPMHCSANIGADGRTALFFGLSGTGKTTLSADPERRLIGDDEHGWSEEGVFNFEGGCYAKCIRLSKEHEPQIWSAIHFGSVLENVVIDPETREADYDDSSITENSRAAYPVDFIPNCVQEGRGGHPSSILFLSADAFGVLPPVSRLSVNQALYHYLSGYTSKLAGTERGITEPQTTFSAGFGAPFLPLRPGVYAEQLRRKIDEHEAKVYLINTGWTGGPYGVGFRIKLPYTRAIVTAVTNGWLDDVECDTMPIFGLSIPRRCPNVPDRILNPRNTWANKEDYDRALVKLAERFIENMATLRGVPERIIQAGPKL